MTSVTELGIQEDVARLRPVRPMGRISALAPGRITVAALAQAAALGDWLEIDSVNGPIRAEVIDLRPEGAVAMVDGTGAGLRLGDAAVCVGPMSVRPHASWQGRLIDPFGQALDGGTLRRGPEARPVLGQGGRRAKRRGLGARVATGLAVFDTLLPLARGQRIGLFAGAGVGKSTLMGQLAQKVAADVVVVVLVGERSREIREFSEEILSPEARAHTIMVVAPSDAPPLTRRQALLSGMTVAEHFRDEGAHVLLLADSITRFAEAHREIALAQGELPTLRGHPASMVQWLTRLAERAGPGPETGTGDITAIFSVLAAGGDLDEPVSDVLRAALDGHVVLDRGIAERGRFPAVNVVGSVSRSLPGAAKGSELALITRARRILATYERGAGMVRSGLYTPGADPELDTAVSVWPKLDAFLGEQIPAGPEAAFARLASLLRQAQ